jgi:hypothetical protein
MSVSVMDVLGIRALLALEYASNKKQVSCNFSRTGEGRHGMILVALWVDGDWIPGRLQVFPLKHQRYLIKIFRNQ